MHLAPHWDVCVGAVVALAIVARAAKAVSWSGAVAGVAVGVAVSAGFGAPGLAVLGTFFVVGTAATKFGYAKKAARGAAEARGGARDWRNVVGKGGVAAAIGACRALQLDIGVSLDFQVFAGALAAALGDTLGTEIGTLAAGTSRTLPTFRAVPPGTPGAVSFTGTFAAAAGAAMIAAVAVLTFIEERHGRIEVARGIAIAGLAATLVESLAVGFGLRAPGFLRNLLTTVSGACFAGCLRVVW